MALILVIEDEAQVSALIVRVLAQAGHTVAESRDGNEGLARIGAEEPDLVITDLLMPNRDGLETIMQIKRERPRIKVLAISGGDSFVGHSYLEVAKTLGADEVLRKPFRRAALLEAVERLLASDNDD